MRLEYSFIIPVYNRPDEVQELLESFVGLVTNLEFEIVIIEDGSEITSKEIVNGFSNKLNIGYYTKPNSGPGDSRNYGMKRAKGNYFIILDSDCILPSWYLKEIDDSLNEQFVDCFGGPDADHPSFSKLQKAINFAMTSFITTGGIRGSSNSINKFQPRSFNMGLSKKAFLESGGFGTIHPGEDPDLSIRLWKLGFKTKLIPNAIVYHKRRVSWKKFYNQVYKFGLVRPILNKWHPKTVRLTYWFPSLFMLGLIFAIFLFLFDYTWPLWIYLLYFSVAFLFAINKTKNLLVSLLSIIAIIVQFFGYGYGFLKSTIALKILNKNEKSIFPKLFFD